MSPLVDRMDGYEKSPRCANSRGTTEGKFRMTNDTNTPVTTEEPHHVSVTARYAPDGTELTPDVKFECRTEADTGCRVYPSCGCESWDAMHSHDYGDGHESVPQDECWLQGWFDNGGHSYEGDDYDDMGDYELPRGMNRAGLIDVTFHDDYVAWSFREATA